MTSPFRFDGRQNPETEEERRKRLLREAMRAAQLGTPFAAGGEPQMLPPVTVTAPRSRMLDASARREADLTTTLETALSEQRRRDESPLARLGGRQVEAPVADVTAAPRAQRRPQPTISEPSEPTPSILSQALNVAAQPLVQPALAGMRFREAVESTLGRERAAERARETQAMVTEAAGPKSGLAQAVAIPAAIAGEAVPYIAAGGGIPGLIRSAAITGLTSQRPGGSTVEALGELTGAESLQRLGQSPYRTAADVALDVGLNVLPGAIGGTVRGVREATRGTRGLEAARAATQQVIRNVGEGINQVGPAIRATGQQLVQEPLTTAALAAGLAGETAVPGISALAAAIPATTGARPFAERTFSRLERAINAAPFEKGTPRQWEAALSKGVAAGEREFTGIDEFLKSTDAKTLTKTEVRDAFEQGRIRLGEQANTQANREKYYEIQGEIERLGNVRAEQFVRERERVIEADDELQKILAESRALRDRYKAITEEPLARFGEAEYALAEATEKYRSIGLPHFDSFRNILTGYDNLSTALQNALPDTVNKAEAIARIAPEDLAVFDEYRNAAKARRDAINESNALRDEMAVIRDAEYRGLQRATEKARDNLVGSRELEAIDESILSLNEQAKQYSLPSYARYVQPGPNENYREVLLTLEGEDAGKAPYRSSHWRPDNPLLHVRMSDRPLPTGERALFVEEIQSDWHQEGRKVGYRKPMAEFQRRSDAINADYEKAVAENDQDAILRLTEEFNAVSDARWREVDKPGLVPAAPFKKTAEWTELALKRVIDEAVQNNYDRVVLVTGEQAANNFDLSKQISRLDWNTPDGGKTFRIFGDGKTVATDVPVAKLPDYVGKELADKIATAGAEQRRGVLQGVDLKVGGEGMKSFYDKLVPNTLRDLGKSMGLKIELEPVDIIAGRGQNLSFRITPETREKVATEGFRLYSFPGQVPEALAQAIRQPGLAAAIGAGTGALTAEEDRFGGAARGALAGAAIATGAKVGTAQLLRAKQALRASNMPQELAEAYARSSGTIDFSGKAAQAIARRARGGFRDVAKTALANYEDGVRELDRISGAGEAAGITPEAAVGTALDRALGSDATVARAISNGLGRERGGVIDPITREIVNEPLEDVFAVLGKDPRVNEQALTYVTALRRLGRAEQAADPEAAARVYGGDVSTLEADRAVVEAFGQKPEFQEFATRLEQYMDSIGQYMVKSGVWSPEQYAGMRDSDAFYIPFKRLLENVQATQGRPLAGGATPGRVTPGVKAFTGSRLTLANPAEALGEYVAAAIKRADRYRVGSTLIDTVNQLGDTNLLTRIEATDPLARGAAQAEAEAAYRSIGLSEEQAGTMAEMFRRVDRNNPVIWKNGPDGREYYLVNDKSLLDAIENLNPANPGAAVTAIVGALAPLKRLTTAFATGYAPGFWLGVNMPRDIVVGIAQNPDITLADMVVGFREAARSIAGQSEMVERIAREGAGQVSQFGGDLDVAGMMRQIAPTTGGQQVRATLERGLTAPMRGLERVGRATEMPMRLAAASAAERRAAQAGVSEAGQRALGSRAYAKATVDFRRRGGNAVERFFEGTVPFYGAAKKGGVAFARAMKNNPQAVGAVTTGVILATMLEHVTTGGELGGAFTGDAAKRQEDTNRLAWERARAIRVGDFRLTLPQEMAVVSAATRVALAALERDDPFVYAQLQEALLAAIPPIYSDLARGEVIAPFPVFRQMQEIAQNRSAFTGRPIVPESMTGAGVGRGVLPEQRRYETTAPTFDVMAAAARGLGFEQASPLQAEYLARGITGRFTPAVTAITDVAAAPMAGRTAKGRVPEPLMRQPLNPLAPFIVPPPRRTQAEEEYFNLRNEIEAAQGTHSRFVSRLKTARERNDVAGEAQIRDEVARLRQSNPLYEMVYQNTGKRLEEKRKANPEYKTVFDKIETAQDKLEDVRTKQDKIQEDVANGRMTQAQARKALDRLSLERAALYRRAYNALATRVPE